MTATYQVKPSKYFKIYQFVVIFQYEPTFVLLDRGRCPRTLSEVWKIQLKTELSSAVSEAYIFQAEDNVRGRRPLYFIYPVSLNVVLLVMLQIHFYICMKEQFVDLFKHMLKLRMSEFPLFHFYFIFLFFVFFCYFFSNI